MKAADPPVEAPAARFTPNEVVSQRRWESWYWLGVPLLAVLAYAGALQVGFLSDDFVLLGQAQKSGIDPSVFIPAPHFFLYRPVGTLLVWQLGWQLWGFHPFPLHVQSLLLHAMVSLLLGLWTAAATGRRPVGWLAGALFAVFPVHLEAVAWAAAQWDLLAAFFGLLSLWLFTLWWCDSGRPWPMYAAALLLYVAAIFAKESTLTFLPLYGVSAWLVTPSLTRAELKRLALALLPFGVALGLNAGIRLVAWGHLGGYGRTPMDFTAVLPVAQDRLTAYLRMLLSPINSTIFPPPAADLVGLAAGATLCLLVILFGRREWRILVAACIWIALALAPVLALPASPGDLQNNRYLYLAAGGYAVLIAALVSAAFSSARTGRPAMAAATATLILAATALCWVQLSPWQTASRRVVSVEAALARLVPPVPAGGLATWYVENPPDNFEGAYMLRLGMGMTRHFLHGEGVPIVQFVQSVGAVPLSPAPPESHALRFAWNEEEGMYDIGGISAVGGPGSPKQASGRAGALTWDFGMCSADVERDWDIANSAVTCTPGTGLTLQPKTNDPQLVLSATSIPPSWEHVSEARIAVEMRSASDFAAGGYAAQWFWKGGSTAFETRSSFVLPVRSDSGWYEYWTSVPLGSFPMRGPVLRFDPVNAPRQVQIRRIELDSLE